jgi:anti-anti-sigma factor
MIKNFPTPCRSRQVPFDLLAENDIQHTQNKNGDGMTMVTPSSKIAGERLSTRTSVAVLRLDEMEYSSLDHAKLTRLRQLLDQAEKLDAPYLVVDLSGVHYFGARFVALLVSIRNQLQRHDGGLALCGLGPLCSELIQVLELDQVFDIYPTRRIALQKIERKVPGGRAEKSRTTPEERQVYALVSRAADRWCDRSPSHGAQPAACVLG